MKIMLAGGGTGGHVYPAIAVGQAMIELYQAEVFYVGNRNSFESRVIENLGWPFFSINIQGFQRKLSFANLIFPFKLFFSLLEVWRIIKNENPDIALGTGGYASGPPVFVAAKMGIASAIQEQNSYPGVTSRILSKYTQYVFLGFKEADKYFPGKKTLFCGNPLRKSIQNSDKLISKKMFQLEHCEKVLLVFGGSQGSHSINANFSKLIPELSNHKDLGIIWQTGPTEYEKYKALYKAYPNVKIQAFIENMADAYAASDIAVSRAGALTLAELAAVGLPAILVPFPYATDNHQFYNARSFEKMNAAVVIEDHGEYDQLLFKKINKLFSNKKRLDEMSARIRTFAVPEAATIIAKKLYALGKGTA